MSYNEPDDIEQYKQRDRSPWHNNWTTFCGYCNQKKPEEGCDGEYCENLKENEDEEST